MLLARKSPQVGVNKRSTHGSGGNRVEGCDGRLYRRGTQVARSKHLLAYILQPVPLGTSHIERREAFCYEQGQRERPRVLDVLLQKSESQRTLIVERGERRGHELHARPYSLRVHLLVPDVIRLSAPSSSASRYLFPTADALLYVTPGLDGRNERMGRTSWASSLVRWPLCEWRLPGGQ